MVCLTDGDMTLSIRYAGYRIPDELVGYELLVTIGGRPLINPDAVVWTPDPLSPLACNRLAPGAALCEGDPPCDILDFLGRALATNQGQFCGFSADGVDIALYPDDLLPGDDLLAIRDLDGWKTRQEEQAAKPADPDDLWNLRLTIGWPQFHRRAQGGAVAFQLLTCRSDLEAFATALRGEFAPFAAEFGVPGWPSR